MPVTRTKFEFSRPVYMIYFTEDHQYSEPRRGYLKSYFVEEFMQNEAGKFKFCDAIWPASYAYVDGTSYCIILRHTHCIIVTSRFAARQEWCCSLHVLLRFQRQQQEQHCINRPMICTLTLTKMAVLVLVPSPLPTTTTYTKEFFFKLFLHVNDVTLWRNLSFLLLGAVPLFYLIVNRQHTIKRRCWSQKTCTQLWSNDYPINCHTQWVFTCNLWNTFFIKSSFFLQHYSGKQWCS